MVTKLKDIIENCKLNGAPFNGCEGCECNEKECLVNLIEEYNNLCSEDEQIEYSE